MKIVQWLYRESAALLAVLAVLVQLVTSLGFNLSADQQGVINAVAVAVAGVVASYMVAKDRLVPSISAAFVAMLNLGVAFGLHLAPNSVALFGMLATSVMAVIVRQHVTAAVSQSGEAVPKDTLLV